MCARFPGSAVFARADEGQCGVSGRHFKAMNWVGDEGDTSTGIGEIGGNGLA